MSSLPYVPRIILMLNWLAVSLRVYSLRIVCDNLLPLIYAVPVLCNIRWRFESLPRRTFLRRISMSSSYLSNLKFSVSNHHYAFHPKSPSVVGYLAVGLRQSIMGKFPCIVQRHNQASLPSGQWKTRRYFAVNFWQYIAHRSTAMPFGPPGSDKVNINVDSLWSGGPLPLMYVIVIHHQQKLTDIGLGQLYTGGNPTMEKYSYLSGIREFIFQNATRSTCTLVPSILEALC
jgi:hypothetical protein